MKRLRLGFYGDDFTGSTDALEALTLAGWRTVLFLAPPEPEEVAQFESLDAIGVAGNSRALSPAQMDEVLPDAFEKLRRLNPEIVHYKVCSTFDSSPVIGSIGHTIELGRKTFRVSCVPVLAAAPVLGRYSAFGHLFARSGLDSPVYRLDRHPTMSRHPVTPMDEADLLIHLGRQTSLPIRLLDVNDLDSEDPDRRFAERVAGFNGVVFFDLMTPQHLITIGRLLHRASRVSPPLFVVGSSGVEYALCAAWPNPPTAESPADSPAHTPAASVDQLLVVSGSCSPVSDRQIGWAIEHGYREIALDLHALLSQATLIHQTVNEALRLLSQRASVIIHTCRGPEDPRLIAGRACLPSLGVGGNVIGERLALILNEILNQHRVPRLVVVGGDTSAYVGSRMGIRYLEYIARVEPGGPLCRAVGSGPIDGTEVIFKGGQVGSIDYLGKAQGRPMANL